ncbi:MAG: hypothetical protein L6Q55_15930 [Azonexus sp.]|nr:hypothetical protein [Azonexus sp.]MCK6385944.1 hypothetical protein [Rhodocyclaceae bacterium]MCK6413892.1 hypothetical protein [Azonexus sp.]
MYLLGILIWVAVVVLLARLAVRRVKNVALRAVLVTLAVPLSFALALADEIIGKFQFDRLCEGAKEVKIYATHPVGEELYTPEGKWREGATFEDRNRLDKIYNSLIKYGEHPQFPELIPAAVPIWKYQQRIYDNTDGRLLAEWTKFGRSGGWIARKGLLGEASHQCEPLLVDQGKLKYQILPFLPKESK